MARSLPVWHGRPFPTAALECSAFAVPLRRRRAWVALSVSLTADSFSFATPSLAKSFGSYSIGNWFPVSASAQSYIASWELLAQCALVVLLDALLGPGHLPVHCVFKCDNSAADSASWKGLSMAQGLCHILSSFLLCQQARRISVYIDHVPGITNDVADALSRGSDPLSLGFEASEEFSVAWNSFPASPELSLFPSAADFSGFLCPVGNRSA